MSGGPQYVHSDALIYSPCSATMRDRSVEFLASTEVVLSKDEMESISRVAAEA